MSDADEYLEAAVRLHDGIDDDGHPTKIMHTQIEVDTLSQLASTQYLREIRDLMKSLKPGSFERLIDITSDLAQAWEEGYTSGHSNAMRQMSDEPNAPKSSNPYREDEDG